MNETTEKVFDMDHSTSELIELFYQLAFFIIGTPINIYALIRTGRSSRDGGVESRLIKLSRQLLIAHLMVLFMYGVWRSYWFYNIVWDQGDLMCKVFSFLCALPFHLWSNMVAAIAIDMLWCITSPLSAYSTGSNRVNWLITIAWIAAIICASPMMVLRGTIDITGSEYNQCYPRTDLFTDEVLITFNFFHVITTFYIPLLIVVVCYFMIGLSIRKQMAERKLLQDGGKGKHNSKTQTRFLRASLAIICTFFFTWLPYQVLALLRVFCSDDPCQNILSKMNWLQAIIIASTCINPFLYRFGAEPKRTSYYCSTMDTVGKQAPGRRADRLLFGKRKPRTSQLAVVQTADGNIQTCPLEASEQLPFQTREDPQINFTIPKATTFNDIPSLKLQIDQR